MKIRLPVAELGQTQKILTDRQTNRLADELMHSVHREGPHTEEPHNNKKEVLGWLSRLKNEIPCQKEIIMEGALKTREWTSRH